MAAAIDVDEAMKILAWAVPNKMQALLTSPLHHLISDGRDVASHKVTCTGYRKVEIFSEMSRYHNEQNPFMNG